MKENDIDKMLPKKLISAYGKTYAPKTSISRALI